MRRRDRRQRRRRAAGGRRADARPDHPRPQPAGAQRPRGLPHPARPPGYGRRADHHADGADERSRPGDRSGCRRRRLRDQAVQPARAGGARARRAAAPRRVGDRRQRLHRQTPDADFDAVAVSVDGARCALRGASSSCCEFLVENRNRVLSRDRLLERVWGSTASSRRAPSTSTSAVCGESSGSPAVKLRRSSASVIDSSNSESQSLLPNE